MVQAQKNGSEKIILHEIIFKIFCKIVCVS